MEFFIVPNIIILSALILSFYQLYMILYKDKNLEDNGIFLTTRRLNKAMYNEQLILLILRIITLIGGIFYMNYWVYNSGKIRENDISNISPDDKGIFNDSNTLISNVIIIAFLLFACYSLYMMLFKNKVMNSYTTFREKKEDDEFLHKDHIRVAVALIFCLIVALILNNYLV